MKWIYSVNTTPHVQEPTGTLLKEIPILAQYLYLVFVLQSSAQNAK